MATQEDAKRAWAEAEERERRQTAARQHMVAQIGYGREVLDRRSRASVGRIYPACPWCGEPFDADKWELEPSLSGQPPMFDVILGSMVPRGMDHEATCPRCGFRAHFRPRWPSEEQP
jgi:predicted RNA-binding Zn-ribbon protein involved in translation (DUF1610 family)